MAKAHLREKIASLLLEEAGISVRDPSVVGKIRNLVFPEALLFQG